MVVELGRTTDQTGTRCAMIPEWVLAQGPTEAWLYGHMCLLAERQGPEKTVNVPLAKLAEKLKVSTRTLQKYLAALRQAGAVAVEPRHDEHSGTRLPNLYILNFAPPKGEAR
ncbi:helix-turn-helix domain-containing protein [Streptomyces lydicus]|uniref:helix-turn-helix domain-containing protein n=1 Tax=Streptomyces lydicus TaxID=47763 RepID=UPI00101154D5|nr:helix-turn-helix domain-containing protein [Streptomyces lydicus]MCZ1012123.1 helix-turn-helix domain-containing protein [Streptomyces lydicus]